jgi:hypothetical protein
MQRLNFGKSVHHVGSCITWAGMVVYRKSLALPSNTILYVINYIFLLIITVPSVLNSITLGLKRQRRKGPARARFLRRLSSISSSTSTSHIVAAMPRKTDLNLKSYFEYEEIESDKKKYI